MKDVKAMNTAQSFILLDRVVVSKSTSQHVAQGCIENITPKPTKSFLLVSKEVVSLTPLFRYYVNRDTLFCYHRASEVFLQRLMALYVASHYKVKLVLLLSKFQLGILWREQHLLGQSN